MTPPNPLPPRPPISRRASAMAQPARGVALRVLAAAVVLAAGLWAFAPLHPPDAQSAAPKSHIKDQTPPPEVLVAHAGVQTLDRAAFSTPIWIAPTPPPPPPPPPVAPPSPPPLRLQLLAIIKDEENGDEKYKAMVYDPNSDKVLVIAAGEKVGSSSIESINELGLRIKDAHGTRSLTLKSEGGRR